MSNQNDLKYLNKIDLKNILKLNAQFFTIYLSRTLSLISSDCQWSLFEKLFLL